MTSSPISKCASKPGTPPVPAPAVGKLALMRAEDCTVSFYRYLYETVGTPWLWFERRLLDDATLAAQIRKETTEIFVLYVGGVPAGYFELDAAAPDETELCYFGLIPEFIGRRSRSVSAARGDRPGLVPSDPATLGAYARLRSPEGARPLPARRVCRLRPAEAALRGPARPGHPAARSAQSPAAAARLTFSIPAACRRSPSRRRRPGASRTPRSRHRSGSLPAAAA